MNITMRRALARVPDVDAGSAVIAIVAFAVIAAAALVSGTAFDLGELWPFLVLGAFVPGFSQLLVVHAVHAAGASRAGILFGMAPLFSALIAIVAFGEPLRWWLAVGTLLVVAGGIALAWESERPTDYRAYGAMLAVTVAVAFGVRDNVARTVTEDVAAEPLAQSTAIMLGASLVLAANLLRRRSALPRFRRAFGPFASSGRRRRPRTDDPVRGARPRSRDRDRAARRHRRALDGRARRDLPRAQRARRAPARRRRAARRRGRRARRRDEVSLLPRPASGRAPRSALRSPARRSGRRPARAPRDPSRPPGRDRGRAR